MPEYNLGGITVQFPHEAYNVQKTFMTSVIQALQDRSNALLESPTGTGKTLTLLCAALAWRQAFHKRHKMEDLKELKVQQDEKSKRQLENAISSDPKQENWNSVAPKIYYASRTHSQLTQVVKELKATVYKPKVCILGSREQLCVHNDIKAASSNATRTTMCRRKVATKSCAYYANLKEGRQRLKQVDEIMDIEDMVKFGQMHRTCPFYLSRESQSEADIVLLPYQYLVDATARKLMNIDLYNSIIIFDEAHNLESCCAEATSFELSSTTLRKCVLETRTCQENARPVDPAIDQAQSFAILADLLDRLRMTIEKVPLSLRDETIKPGAFIYELLKEVGIDSATIGILHQEIDSAMHMLAGSSASESQHFALSNLSSALRMVFRREYFADSDEPTTEHSQYYRVHIEKVKNSGAGASERKLSYWCFCPGLVMKDLVNSKVRCVILASGTLAPLSSFASELLLDFPVRLENSHVIEANQAMVAVLRKGPAGSVLSSSFQSRGKHDYKMDLGNTIVNLSKVIPEGLLVFFPSYSLMADCISAWKSKNGQSNSIWDRLNQQKEIFVEPKSRYEFTMAISGYYSKIKDPAFDGAVFLGVCRGKVSEGVDFADGRGRAVVITGIPFANSKDPKVVEKKNFLDDILFKSGNRAESISGNTWYQQQALRAVNQAIGRVIRHRKDYGAILLCDERFANQRTVSQLSAWIRDHVTVYDSYGELHSNLIRFFKGMEQNNSVALPQATKFDVKTAATERELMFARRPINLGGDDSEGSGPLVSRNENSIPVEKALHDYAIITDTQLSNMQSANSFSNSQSSQMNGAPKPQPKATLEQAQEYSRQMATLGPEKHRQYRVLIRQYKKKEIKIVPFIEQLIDIFIGENRLDLLKSFRIFLPHKHTQLFDQMLRMQEPMPLSSSISRLNAGTPEVKRQRIQ